MESAVKSGVIAVLFVLLAVSLSTTPSDQLAISVWLFLSSGKSDEADDIRSIVVVDLIREMEKQGFSIIPEQSWQAKLSQEEISSLELIEDTSAIQLAKKEEADIALIGSIEVEEKDIILKIHAYDVLSNSLVFNKVEKESKDIGIYIKVSSLTRELIDTLLTWAASQPTGIVRLQSETPVLDSELDEHQLRETTRPQTGQLLETEARPWDEPSEARTPYVGESAAEETRTGPDIIERPPQQEEGKIRVTLLSNDEGAQVYIGPTQRAGTIENGKLVVEVPGNITLAIETKKPGFHVNREYFELKNQSVEIRLRPLVKTTRFGLELFSTSSQFLGIGAGLRLYIVPDYILFRTDNYVYFSTISEGDNSPSAFHDDFRIQIGSYLFVPPHRRVRFGIATGIGLITSVLSDAKTEPENSVFFDFYWDLINLWLDLNWDKGAVFFRVETKYALGIGTCLLEPGFLSNYGPQFTVGWFWKFG